MSQVKAAVCAGVLLMAGMAAAPARADLLFSNPGTDVACAAGCWASGGSPDYAFRTWDDFTIGVDARVTTVTWRGVAFAEGLNLQDLDPLSWDLGFFADAAGTPGAELYTANIADAGVSRIFLGTGGLAGTTVNYWEFSAVLPTEFAVAAGTTYWFSPFSNQSDYYPVFGWSGSTGGSTFQTLLTNDSTYVRSNNRAFTLSGVVPEPQTWALMILGFGAAGAALRRKQAARAT